jgi:DNA-binding NarL/FixJ family response regulator/tetratricopeptide (TPR) repeat protein
MVRTTLTDEIPLLGRETEMDRILGKLAGPMPVAFVLAGAAGVGKSRLAFEAAKSATGLGFSTAHAVASRAAASIPFGPFAPFLPEIGPSPGGLLGLLRQASDAIAGRAGPDGRLLLVVDDAQHLDDGSAALVHQLVQTKTCSALLSLRAPGPAPDPVTALWKDGLAERIELTSWSEPQTEQVLTAVLGGPVSSSTVRQLFRISGGNAFYLRELLIGTVGSGALSETGGIWSLNKPLSAPSRLVELVASRLAALAPETIAVIEMLAMGEPLGMSLLDKLADSGGLDDAEAQGFVQVHQDDRRMQARLAHPIYGEAVRQSMPRSRQRRIAAMLAVAIEATGARRREDLLRLGRWHLDAGDRGDPVLLTRAARRAQEMFDMELSARLAQAALDSGAGVEAGLTLGEAMFRSGRHAEAESVLAGMTELCRSDRDLARIANARAHNLHNTLGDSAGAAAVLDQALAVIKEDTPRLQLLGRLATNRLLEGDPEGALAAAGPLLSSDDDSIVSRGSYSASIGLALLGRGDEAVSVAHAGLHSHRRVGGLPQLPESQLLGAIFGHVAAGRLAQAEAEAEANERLFLAAGDKEGHATALFMLGWTLIERGLLARASTAFLDGASVNRELHDMAALRWCVAGVALAEAMSGHGQRAAAADAERDELPIGILAIYETDLIERSRAWVMACVGELSRACEILLAAAARASASHLRVAEARLLHDVARLGQPGLVADQLAALAETVDGEYVTAMARHAAALVAGRAADLEASGQTFTSLGARLLAAEAYAAAARAYRSEGLARAAASATRLAAELVAACGDVRTPGLSAGEAQERLTRREREVAALAAAGASSREIAARLVLSVRTVDNHLQNIYSKLGVTSREELADVLRS